MGQTEPPRDLITLANLRSEVVRRLEEILRRDEAFGIQSSEHQEARAYLLDLEARKKETRHSSDSGMCRKYIITRINDEDRALIRELEAFLREETDSSDLSNWNIPDVNPSLPTDFLAPGRDLFGFARDKKTDQRPKAQTGRLEDLNKDVITSGMRSSAESKEARRREPTMQEAKNTHKPNPPPLPYRRVKYI